MFNGIEVRGLTWPFQEIHTATSKPIGDMTLSMLRVIILLKHHDRPKFALAHGRIVFSRMSSYTYWSMVPTILFNEPMEVSEKHPQTITDPPPCFTVGHWY
uniref:Uncharacterized protein n=1 Tax=Caenorhabditis japonica TaxID=281687 RepID=A0A8R1EQM6_CAEJA